jgi:hypothetical protein
MKIFLSCICKFISMAYKLTKKAQWFLLENNELKAKVCNCTGIKITGIDSAIKRDSRILTTYMAIMAISQAMKIKPEEVIEPC